MAKNNRPVTRRKPALQRQKPTLKEQLQAETPVIINDIEVCTFDKFLKCMVNNEIYVLRVSGNPSQHELFMSWITILSAYLALINDKSQLKYLKMVAKMEALNLRITVVKALCDAIQTWYDEKLVDCLQSFGYKLKYTKESLKADIERTLIELSNDEYKLIKMKSDYDKDKEAKKKKGEAPTKNSYMKILYAIEKHREQRYPPEKITVYEFGMWYNEIVEYNAAIEAMNNKALDESKYRK